MMGQNDNYLLLRVLLLSFVILSVFSCKKNDENGSVIRDRNGNEYTSVTIGSQTWMVENLKTTKFSDGTEIPLIAEAEAWSVLTTPGYQWYNNSLSSFKVPYGALYNFYAVSTGKLCPTGWHVPTDTEWTTLTSFLLGEEVSGGKLKEAGLTHWDTPNTDASNETGFTALPGGYISSSGSYGNIGYEGTWWTASESMEWDAFCRRLSCSNGRMFATTFLKKSGFSVRCLMD
jgi:uncharacterized protein (TIGR02145 family)